MSGERRCQALDVSIPREHFPLKSDEPIECGEGRDRSAWWSNYGGK